MFLSDKFLRPILLQLRQSGLDLIELLAPRDIAGKSRSHVNTKWKIITLPYKLIFVFLELLIIIIIFLAQCFRWSPHATSSFWSSLQRLHKNRILKKKKLGSWKLTVDPWERSFTDTLKWPWSRLCWNFNNVHEEGGGLLTFCPLTLHHNRTNSQSDGPLWLRWQPTPFEGKMVRNHQPSWSSFSHARSSRSILA